MTKRMYIIMVALAVCLSGYSREGMSQGQADVTPVAPSSWISSAHFGYGVESQSSTGFGQAGGSLFFLDLSRLVAEGVDVGFRTSGMGGNLKGMSFQRMASGPLVTWRIHREWQLQGAWGFFKEAGVKSDGTGVYDSRGQSILLGWERMARIGTRAQFAFGGFWAKHWGSLDLTGAASPLTSRRFENVSRNEGQSRGVEMAIRVDL